MAGWLVRRRSIVEGLWMPGSRRAPFDWKIHRQIEHVMKAGKPRPIHGQDQVKVPFVSITCAKARRGQTLRTFSSSRTPASVSYFYSHPFFLLRLRVCTFPNHGIPAKPLPLTKSCPARKCSGNSRPLQAAAISSLYLSLDLIQIVIRLYINHL